jgi:Flp pilus assembly CpaF family ATPase
MTEQCSTVKDRAKRKLERDMGPDVLCALTDPKTVEIMLNADGKLWQERRGITQKKSPARSPSLKGNCP